jgi:hypothetical protein
MAAQRARQESALSSPAVAGQRRLGNPAPRPLEEKIAHNREYLLGRGKRRPARERLWPRRGRAAIWVRSHPGGRSIIGPRADC